VDAQVRALEEQGANALPIFCNPATDTDEQEDAEWVTDNWLIADDGNSIVDAVLSSFMFSLSMDERGRSADDEGVLLKTSSSIASAYRSSRRSRRCARRRATSPAIRA